MSKNHTGLCCNCVFFIFIIHLYQFQDYKPPMSKDIPIDMRVYLLHEAKNPIGYVRSKGECCFMLSEAYKKRPFSGRDFRIECQHDCCYNQHWIGMALPYSLPVITIKKHIIHSLPLYLCVVYTGLTPCPPLRSCML